MHTLIYLAILLLTYHISALSLRPAHQYWFLSQSPKANGGSDSRWDYCDLKCLYLQKYNPDKDFVVLILTAPLRDTFAACYVKNGDDYTLWNKVISNKYYENNCGKDDKDWANMGMFSIKAIYGVGIGSEITEQEAYQDI